MNHERSLFPHTKIDWKIADLSQKATRAGGNIVMLIQLMKLHLSKRCFMMEMSLIARKCFIMESASYKKTVCIVDALSMMASGQRLFGQRRRCSKVSFKNRIKHRADSDAELGTGSVF